MAKRQLPNELEAGFQQAVIEMAELYGWEVMHVRKSTAGDKWLTATSIAGWPDLTLFHPSHGIRFVELKSDTGVVASAQSKVLAALEAAGCDADIWRPRDWSHIERVLVGRH